MRRARAQRSEHRDRLRVLLLPECILWCDGCEEYVPLDCEREYFRDQWYCTIAPRRCWYAATDAAAVCPKKNAVKGGDSYTYCPACAAQCPDCQRAWQKGGNGHDHPVHAAASLS